MHVVPCTFFFHDAVQVEDVLGGTMTSNLLHTDYVFHQPQRILPLQAWEVQLPDGEDFMMVRLSFPGEDRVEIMFVNGVGNLFANRLLTFCHRNGIGELSSCMTELLFPIAYESQQAKFLEMLDTGVFNGLILKTHFDAQTIFTQNEREFLCRVLCWPSVHHLPA